MPGIGPTSRGGLRLSYTAPGFAGIAVELSRFATEVSDFRPYWNTTFKDRWREWMLDIFRSQGAATGQGWAPLTPTYAIWKAEHFSHEGILVRLGSLSGSLINPDRSGLGVWRPTPSAIEVGTTVRYAIWHQKGTRRRDGRQRMVARPILRPTPTFMNALGKGLQTFVAVAWSQRRREQRAYSGA